MKNLVRIQIVSVVLGLAWHAHAAPVLLLLPLDESQGVPSLDGPTGVGTAFLAIAPDVSVISRNITVGNIDFTLAAMHIQKAPDGLAEPIVVGFDNSLSGTDLTDPILAAAMGSPMDYRLNMRDRLFPVGTVPGPVTPIPDPSTLSLAVIGLTSLALSRRRCRSL